LIRAVLDVNVLLSAIIGPLGLPRHILEAWEDGRFHSITSAGLIGELRVKLALPRISRKYHNPSLVAGRFIKLLEDRAEIIAVSLYDVEPVTGDPEDDYVLATVRLGQANYLITGNHGLLALATYAGARIITPRTFVETKLR
jgi:putative PIN family toxin of toxin-antitoxin system